MSIESSPEKCSTFNSLLPMNHVVREEEPVQQSSFSSSGLPPVPSSFGPVAMTSRQQRMYEPLAGKCSFQRWRDVVFEESAAAEGPTTHGERHLWMERCWTASTPEMRDRLIRNLDRLRVATFMSGMGCMVLIIFQISWLVSQLIEDPPRPKFVCACDCALTRVVTLADFDEQWRAEHLFWHIEDLLPDELRDSVLQEVPKQDVPLQDRQEAYANIQATIRKYFAEHPQARLRLDAACAKHGLTQPSCDLDFDGAESTKHTLTLTAAGVDCTDTTRQGKQKGSAGPSRLGHIVWSALQGVLCPDIVLGECTQDWLPLDLAHDLPTEYDMVKCELRPEYFGDPYSRPRAVVEAHNRNKAYTFHFCSKNMPCCM